MRRIGSTTSASWLVAILAILPLLTPSWWSGLRLGLSEPVLGVVSPTEQPLAVTTPVGLWALALVVSWYGLAYWRRELQLWEPALLLVGGAIALARFGNVWLFGLLLLAPLARQLSARWIRPWQLAVLAAAALVATASSGLSAKPPDLDQQAVAAIRPSAARGAVFADWHWAPVIQQELGGARSVVAAGGLTSHAVEFWVDYLRVCQGHERWAEILRSLQVDLLVLSADGQQRQVADLVRQSSEWRVLYETPHTLVAERLSS